MLPAAGQCGDLHGKRLHILVITDVESIARQLSLNPIPYIMITIVAVNCAYLLPVSTRAIPVSYGLNPGDLFKYGMPLTIVNIILTTIIGYFVINYVGMFSAL